MTCSLSHNSLNELTQQVIVLTWGQLHVGEVVWHALSLVKWD